MSRVRIVSDGTPQNTSVFVDGQPFTDEVVGVAFSIEAGRCGVVTLALASVDVDLTGDLAETV